MREVDNPRQGADKYDFRVAALATVVDFNVINEGADVLHRLGSGVLAGEKSVQFSNFIGIVSDVSAYGTN